MIDLISRSALLASVRRVSEYDETGCSMEYSAIPEWAVMLAPAVDAVEVVHARWAYTDEGYKVCSNCCWEHPVLDNNGFTVADTFCPSCGAKMDGGADDGEG